MASSAILFDARNPDFSLGGPLTALFLIFVVGLATVLLVRPELGRGHDLTMNRVGPLVLLMFAVPGLVAALLPIPVSLWSASQFRSRNVRVIEGCVESLERIVHPNEHNLADTYFRVDDEHFHFNSSPWLPGFHNEDDIIAAQDQLRLTLSGNRVLRIERSGSSCRQAGADITTPAPPPRPASPPAPRL